MINKTEWLWLKFKKEITDYYGEHKDIESLDLYDYVYGLMFKSQNDYNYKEIIVIIVNDFLTEVNWDRILRLASVEFNKKGELK